MLGQDITALRQQLENMPRLRKRFGLLRQKFRRDTQEAQALLPRRTRRTPLLKLHTEHPIRRVNRAILHAKLPQEFLPRLLAPKTGVLL